MKSLLLLNIDDVNDLYKKGLLTSRQHKRIVSSFIDEDMIYLNYL